MRKNAYYITAENIQDSIYARINNSPSIYMVCLDTEGYYTYVNSHFARKFSHISTDFIGVHHDNTIYTEDIEATHKVLKKCADKPENTYTIQLRKPDENGENAWTFWELSALKNEQNEIIGVLCIGYDITDTEAINRQAQEYTQKVDNIIDNLTDGLVVVDKDWHFLKVNRVAEETIGLNRHQLLGKDLWNFVADTHQFNYPKALRTAMEAGSTSTFEEHIPQLEKWFEVTAYPSEEGLTIIFKDITERKEAEERLTEFNNKLLALHNSTSDINILISPDYKILSFNKVAEQSTHTLYKTQMTVGQSIWDYILPGTQDDFQQCFDAALRGEAVEVKVKLFFKPGLTLWFRVRYFPVKDAKDQLIGVAFNSTNIDEQQRQLEQLEEIARIYSHEIRRPVATILGITQLFNLEELTFENKEWFDYLKKTTVELDHVIHKIVRKTSEIN